MNIIRLRRVWYSVSLALLIGSIVAVAVFGLRFGIDFTGGSLVSVRFEDRPVSVEIERALEPLQIGSVLVQPVGEKDTNIRLSAISEDQHAELIQLLKNRFTDQEITELRFDSIGPSIGAELRSKSIKALLIAFVAILIYIAYAFRHVSVPIQNWKYGLVTILAALHDIIIPIGAFAVLGAYMGFEIDTPFVVAILTVLGYSINDTIVVLDRVRENLHRMGGNFDEIVGTSLKQTYVRSLNTSFTTLFALVAIFLFGGDTLKPFALALIIGIAAGTYSSIFIGAPLLVSWEKWASRK